MRYKLVIEAAIVLLASSTALAAPAPGSRADELLDDADAVLQRIDAGPIDPLWDDAAPFVKAKIGKQTFIAQLKQMRQSFGPVTARGWASIVRLQYSSDRAVPDGLYANVDYASHTAGGQTVFERVSFRLEPDHRWHLTGYNARRTQQDNPVIPQGNATP